MFTQLWEITIFNGKNHCKCSFSIAMLNYQMVYFLVLEKRRSDTLYPVVGIDGPFTDDVPSYKHPFMIDFPWFCERTRGKLQVFLKGDNISLAVSSLQSWHFQVVTSWCFTNLGDNSSGPKLESQETTSTAPFLSCSIP